jgi:hypothetical protein
LLADDDPSDGLGHVGYLPSGWRDASIAEDLFGPADQPLHLGLTRHRTALSPQLARVPHAELELGFLDELLGSVSGENNTTDASGPCHLSCVVHQVPGISQRLDGSALGELVRDVFGRAAVDASCDDRSERLCAARPLACRAACELGLREIWPLGEHLETCVLRHA